MVNPKAIIAKHTTEAEFQLAVLAYAGIHGWLAHHDRPSQSKDGWVTAIQGDAGFPDLVLARGGIVHHWELKSEKGVVSEAQQEWVDALHGRVMRPSQWDVIRRILA